MMISAVGSVGCIDDSSKKIPEGSIRIGALLPFTGDLAASGANIERALIWAAEQINEQGGVAGHPIALITRDTNSAVERGMDSARALIEEEGVVAVIGPEYADLALEMMPLIEKNDVIQISGGVSSTAFTELDEKNVWFRTCPSSLTLGSVLAKKIYDDGMQNPVILHIADEYGTNFAEMVRAELTAYLGDEPFQLGFQPDRSSYREVLTTALERQPDAIVLVAYPKSGAVFVSDWNAMGAGEKLYFSDALFNEVFVSNVPPGSIDGMVGITHAATTDAEVFAKSFAERWPGDTPLPASYFNFDALALLALAIEQAYIESGSEAFPSTEQIADHLVSVSSISTGKKVAWYEIDYGFDLLRNQDVPSYAGINYRGASGSLDLDEHGEVFSGLAQLWTVEDDRIVKGETVSALPISQ